MQQCQGLIMEERGEWVNGSVQLCTIIAGSYSRQASFSSSRRPFNDVLGVRLLKAGLSAGQKGQVCLDYGGTKEFLRSRLPK